jgi:dTDP-glucose 4,6-dehydratase
MYHIFANTDWEVVGIATYSHKGLAERLTEMLREHPQYWSRLTLITHDLTKPFTKKLKRQIGHIDYIINMASLSDVEASIQDPVPFIKNNVDLVLNVLEYARDAKPEVFFQVSTDEVYGASGEDQTHPEWSAIVPSNPYSASKAAQEAICISYWRSYNVPVVITNTMNNFGEFQQPSKYPVIIQRALMNDETLTVHGKPGELGTRYYLHSRNHADAILYIIENLPPYMHQPGEVDKPDRYNVVGDKQVDNLSLAQLIAKLMGKELDYELVDFHSTRPGHDMHYGLDGRKLKTLGWVAPLGFEESLKNTIKWQMENPEWIQ